MVDLNRTREAPIAQLFEEIGRARAGMLGLQGSEMPLKPMTAYLDDDNRRIVFFTARDHDLTAAVAPGSHAHFCLVGKDHDYHACLSGTIAQVHDTALIDRFWNPIISAWYPGGKIDPKLILLVLSLEDAAIWASTDSTLRFGWEIVKSLATQSEPDLGIYTHITF